MTQLLLSEDKNFCRCGCCREIPFLTIRGKPQRYANHHTSRIHKRSLIPCACGCEELILNIGKRGYPIKFKRGHAGILNRKDMSDRVCSKCKRCFNEVPEKSRRRWKKDGGYKWLCSSCSGWAERLRRKIFGYNKEYYQKTKEHQRVYGRSYRSRPEVMARNRIRHQKYSSVHRMEIRRAVINHYTDGLNCCQCPGCNEMDIRFLTIDHINGGGRKHAIENKIKNLAAWLIKQKFPEGYQILCFNCNCGRALNGGICPHNQA